MTDVVIRVEGLSKQYRIGGPQARYKTLRESVVGARPQFKAVPVSRAWQNSCTEQRLKMLCAVAGERIESTGFVGNGWRNERWKE